MNLQLSLQGKQNDIPSSLSVEGQKSRLRLDTRGQQRESESILLLSFLDHSAITGGRGHISVRTSGFSGTMMLG